MAGGRNKRNPANPTIAAAVRDSRSTASSGFTTPAVETPTKETIKDSIKLNTDIPNVVTNPALFNQLSPSVRDVAEHAAALKSVLSRLGPIYDLVEREASRMAEVSPFLAGKDQVDEARNRLAAEVEKRDGRIHMIKMMIEVEKRKFMTTINERLEKMINDVVKAKVAERVKAQVAELVEPYQKILQGSRGRTVRNEMFFLNIEARNRNVLIRSKFPQERITPVFRPINVEFQIPQSPTDSPRVGPAGGGYNPSPSQKFPETLGALIKMSLSDSTTLMKDYGLGADISDKKVPEEARLDNLNKLMLHFGIGYRLHPGPVRKGPIMMSLWDRR